MNLIGYFVMGAMAVLMLFIWKELERIANALVTLCNIAKTRRP